MDAVVDPAKDWRRSALGQALIAYAEPYVEPVVSLPGTIENDLPYELHDAYELDNDHDGHEEWFRSPGEEFTGRPVDFSFPLEHQPLVGIIDTGFSANNPDFNYANVRLGWDFIDRDGNPLLEPGQGDEHGTHVLGLIKAERGNGIGIDGINPEAPIWLGRAVGSGQWTESLVEFVNAAKESGQPNAVVNLSLDLTQINPDGSMTTRYELTPQERSALEYARQHGVLVVVAAGNDGSVMSALGQASQEFDNIITVGSAARVNDAFALSSAYSRADYSSYGYGLDILSI